MASIINTIGQQVLGTSASSFLRSLAPKTRQSWRHPYQDGALKHGRVKHTGPMAELDRYRFPAPLAGNDDDDDNDDDGIEDGPEIEDGAGLQSLVCRGGDSGWVGAA